MKILTVVILSCILVTGCSQMKSEFSDRMDTLEQRIQELERLCSEMNENIGAMKTIVEAIQRNDFITSITPIVENGKEIGYSIAFSKSGTITIHHGQDAADGKDGTVPVIGVTKDTDGNYYWTLDGEWLLDEDGKKIPAESKDFSKGEDGVTPQLKIEDGFWMISYDDGKTWTELGEATGDDGQNSFFKSIDTSIPGYVLFILADGTELKVPLVDNSLLEKVQDIKYVPDTADRKICFFDSAENPDVPTAAFTFRVSPESSVKVLENHWSDLISMEAFYTSKSQQSTAANVIELKILEFTANHTPGTFTVLVSGSNLSQDFYDGNKSAMAYLVLSNGGTTIVSENIPIMYEIIEDGSIFDYEGTYQLTAEGEILVTDNGFEYIEACFTTKITLSVGNIEEKIMYLDGWLADDFTGGRSFSFPVWYDNDEKGRRLTMLNMLEVGKRDENGYCNTMASMFENEDHMLTPILGYFPVYEIKETRTGLKFIPLPIDMGTYIFHPVQYYLYPINSEMEYFGFYDIDLPAGPYSAVKISDKIQRAAAIEMTNSFSKEMAGTMIVK